MADAQPWYSDKKIPVGIIVVLVMHVIGGVWYAAKLDSRVEDLDRRTKSLAKESKKLKESVDAFVERVYKIESKADYIISHLDGINNKLDKQVAPCAK